VPRRRAQADLAGKSVQMIIGAGTGGGYDLWAAPWAGMPAPPGVQASSRACRERRRLRRQAHLQRGAGAPCSAIARDAALGPLSGATGARFDPVRLSWIGTPTKGNVCIAYHTTGQNRAGPHAEQLSSATPVPARHALAPKALAIARVQIQAGGRISRLI
jgi:hypothetical protein